MNNQHSNADRNSTHQVIDEEGTPVVDATDSSSGAGSAGTGFGGDEGQRSAYIGGMPGMPGMQIPDRFLNRKGKPSLWKMIGWRGVLAIVVVVAVLVTLAIISAAFLLFAIPILIVAALVGAVVRKVGGKGRGPSQGVPASRIVVVRRQ